MIYRVRHNTRYRYAEPVTLCHNLAHVLPRSTPWQTCLSSQIQVWPRPVYGRRHEDYFGNAVYHFSIEEAHDEMVIEVVSEIQLSDVLPSLDLDLGVTCEQALLLVAAADDPQTVLAREFVCDSPLVSRSDELRAYAEPCFAPQRPLLSAARALTEKIFTEFTFDPGATSVATPLGDVLAHRRGVCQDFAHLAIGCLRALGFPARYMSGYLETLPPPGQARLVGVDASHAWFAVYSPGEGWFEFDPTNNQPAGRQHLTCAWGRDYSDVPPLAGVIFGGGQGQSLAVEVDVLRLGGN